MMAAAIGPATCQRQVGHHKKPLPVVNRWPAFTVGRTRPASTGDNVRADRLL
jgi:hypothetical protein